MEPNFQKPGNTPFICKFQQQQIQAYMLLFSQIFKHIQANLSLQTAVRKQEPRGPTGNSIGCIAMLRHRPQLQPPGVQHHTVTHTHIQAYRAMKKQEVQVQQHKWNKKSTILPASIASLGVLKPRPMQQCSSRIGCLPCQASYPCQISLSYKTKKKSTVTKCILLTENRKHGRGKKLSQSHLRKTLGCLRKAFSVWKMDR